MKAMILAAGVGSRLRPLTDEIPKALIEVGGKPMLERVILRLVAAGVDGIIINTHHHADKVARFLEEKNNFGIRVEQSCEPQLLDTGGGIKKASWFFSDGEPFLVHNADVFTDMDINALYAAHLRGGALVTMAVSARETSRPLAFGPDGFLRGRWTKSPEFADCARLGNGDVYAVSPAALPLMTETGPFSIVEFFLRLAREGGKIKAFRCDRWFWSDIGRPETLEKARVFAARNTP
ncbi:MAG: sugar phosphate nucleotidyltransferase [Elusimicrobiales bacterium]